MAFPIILSVSPIVWAKRVVGVTTLLWVAASSTLRAADVVAVEKLSKDQLRQTLQAASPDTVIEYQGQSKTLAQWRTYYQAQFKLDVAQLKKLADARKAKIEAAAKALQDQQDASTAEENARVMKEYEELNSR